MANDEELKKGLRNIEEILQRLDDQAQNRQWLKEYGPLPARNSGKDIKRAEPLPVKADLPEAAPEAIAPVTPAETPFIAPAPAVKNPEPVKAAEGPVIESLKPGEAPEKVLPPQQEFKPAIKPAKKPFAFNKNILVFLGLGLVIAGAAYQLAINSAKARYAQAGQLVKDARPTAAISAYTKIIAGQAGSLEAAYSQYAIAEIKAAQGDLPGAIERYEKYLVAAPAGDARVPLAKFNIAEIEFRQSNLPEAEYMYNNADIRASANARQAADRVAQIKAVNAQVAAARKSAAKTPAKAVEAFSAVLAAYPGLKTATAGLEEAQKALAAANDRQAARAAKAGTRAPETARAKAPAAAKAAAYTKEQLDACNAVWMMEKIQGRLDAEADSAKTRNHCDGLKANLTACKGLQDEFKAIKSLTPGARTLIEQEIDPEWTAAKQAEQDRETLSSYEAHRCAQLVSSGN